MAKLKLKNIPKLREEVIQLHKEGMSYISALDYAVHGRGMLDCKEISCNGGKCPFTKVNGLHKGESSYSVPLTERDKELIATLLRTGECEL